MSDIISLKAVKRENFGTGAAREARRNNLIPAVSYAKDVETEHFSVYFNEVIRVINVDNGFRGRTVKLSFEDGAEKSVRLIDVQLHPVKDTPLHLDFTPVAA